MEMQRPAMLGRTWRPLAPGSQVVSGRANAPVRAKAARWEPGQRRLAQALGQARRPLGRARRPHAGTTTVNWCATELFLWRMDDGAPQKFSTFCGASFVHAPQKVRILWRMPTHAPQKVRILWRMPTHAPQNFCGSHVQPLGQRSIWDILWRTVAGAPQKRDILWRTVAGAPQKSDILWRTW